MVILALDQATVTGWAVVTDTGSVRGSGTWTLCDKKRTGESRGMRYIRFRANLERVLRDYGPLSMVCHEQTLLRGGAATEIANGLKALILEFGAFHGIPVTCVHTTELKKWATGSGKSEKPAMIEAAKALSGCVVPIDDNEADALLIGLWTASKYGLFPGPQWPTDKKAHKRRGDS